MADDLKPNVWVFDERPLPLVMFCPAGHQHIDEGEWATKPHKTHQCQYVYPLPKGHVGFGGLCGLEWRPADFPTVGVKA